MNLNDDLPVWQQSESRRLEFKENFPSGNKVAKTVIAFANGAGGRIVFGIRDNPREISGRLMNLKEIWQKNGQMSRDNIIIS